MNPDLDQLRQWIGRKESKTDVAAAWPVAALAATLDRRDPDPQVGDSIPLGWHWLYFLETTPASGLGPDGHARRGGFLPPVALPHRMWAGGRIEFRRALQVGERIERESEIVSVEAKAGRSGQLVFVTVRHTVSASNGISVIEEHDIVYRESTTPGVSPPPAKPTLQPAAWAFEIVPDAVLLFRFSALIFNAHRIHYDLDYCRDEEHYPGLIVHGPLQTILMLELCRRHGKRPVKKLDYRALRPVFHGEPLAVNGNPDASGSHAELWTADAAGSRAMAGTAYF
jgi:3-methylfumaryl-CoA hydratase